MNGFYFGITCLVLVILYFIYFVNKVIYLSKRVERSKSVIDVYLKKRYDLIPNLVNIVKEYTKYESETLEKITSLRESFDKSNDLADATELNNIYKDLLLRIEKYPDIKANENFLHLQKTLVKVEDELQAARRIYINDITNYNTKIETFPGNMLSKIFKYKKEDLPKYITEEININF